jgi:putative ABC transport system ATP-binding protein
MSVTCEHLTVEYSSGGYVVRPVDGFELRAARGELALLLGASGCGKTTVLSVLAAILRPSGGRVRVDGVEVTDLEGGALTHFRRERVGIVFQSFNLVPSLTAAENVQLPLLAAGLSRREARRRAEELLERFGLGERTRHRPNGLSGGEQQRVAIARAVALEPPVLLADEPTAHLDYIQVEGVLKLLRQLADDGCTVIVATHDDRLIPLADRVITMTPVAAADGSAPREKTMAAGEFIFRQGDPGDRIYVVQDGRVDIVRIREDGGEELLAEVTPGHYFGELAPMLGLRRSASARAAVSSCVLGMGPTEFRARFGGSKLSALLGPGS